MWNVMKAQCFQLVRNRSIYILGLVLIICLGLIALLMCLASDREVTGSQFLAEYGIMTVLYSTMFFMVGVVAHVMCGDFTNRTVSYELLSGHSRGQVFFGRAVVAIGVAVIGTIFLSGLYPLVISLMNGWGDTLGVQSILFRYLLTLFVFIRIASEFVLLAIWIRDLNITYLIGFVMTFCQIFLSVFEEKTNCFITGIANCAFLLGYEDLDYLIGGEAEPVMYVATLPAELVYGTIGISLLSCVICLALGYSFFKKIDLK